MNLPVSGRIPHRFPVKSTTHCLASQGRGGKAVSSSSIKMPKGRGIRECWPCRAPPLSTFLLPKAVPHRLPIPLPWVIHRFSIHGTGRRTPKDGRQTYWLKARREGKTLKQVQGNRGKGLQQGEHKTEEGANGSLIDDSRSLLSLFYPFLLLAPRQGYTHSSLITHYSPLGAPFSGTDFTSSRALCGTDRQGRH